MGTTSKVWLQTATGRVFNPQLPDPNDIVIEDIAHALGNLCRFTGHAPVFYSVAQHSVLVSYLVNPIYAKEALLHDAAEAYLNDLNTPVKSTLGEYRQLERDLQRAIYRKFGLVENEPKDVQDADALAFRMEIIRFFHYGCPLWAKYINNPQEYNESPIKIPKPLSPAESKVSFLLRYDELFERAVVNHDVIEDNDE